MSTPLRRPAHSRRGGVGRLLRQRGAATTAAVTAGASAVAFALVTGSLVVAARAGDQGCTGQTRRLTVLATPEVGAGVRAAAEALDQQTGSCLLVSVTERAPADAVRKLSTASDDRPQVWIPDSSIWTNPVAKAGVRLPATNPSVALSPVVFAVPRRVAEDLGWPARRVEIGQLLGSADAGGPVSDRPVRLGLPDPQRSAATVGAVLAVERAVAGRRDGLAAAVRTAQTDLPADSPALLDRLSHDTALAVPVSEQSVSAHNARTDATNAIASYPGTGTGNSTGGMALDYPFVVLTQAEREKLAAARLLRALREGAGAARLKADGFRDSAGAGGPALSTAVGVDPRAPAGPGAPSGRDVDRAVQTLRLIPLRTRLLAVIDVSGSMGETVPGAGGKTRMDLTKEAAALGLAAYPDDADVGLWVFSTDLTATTDYRQVVPIGPLGVRRDGETGRSLLVRALGGVQHRPNGGTGLYDSTLAAVRAARDGWNAERVNSVLLLTDGRNEDDSSITLTQLLNTLRRERDDERPVPVISIAYGPGSDAAALQAISRATGGTRYLAKDPRQIQQVLLDAIGRRPCRPGC